MELAYSAAILLFCTPLAPPEFGSSINIIAAIPNLFFGFGIIYLGDIGWRDMVALFAGDDGIRDRDRVVSKID